MSMSPKIAIFRTDHLGDLLLSLPAIQQVREQLPESEITVITKPQFFEPLQGYFLDHQIRWRSVDEQWDYEQWDAALVLHANFQQAFKLWRSRTIVRTGQWSRLWSFVFFNLGVRQKRSLAQKNEAEYSLELANILLQRLGKLGAPFKGGIQLPVDVEAEKIAEKALNRLGIASGDRFFVLHPGMAGSALNLSFEKYRQLAEQVLLKGPVLLSVGPAPQDQLLGEQLLKSVPKLKKMSGLSLNVLKEVFRKSSLVVAPSTGPLHLAHLVGVPVLGIYSPIPSHHPNRWAPYGGKTASTVLFPEVRCPAKRSCLGSSCSSFNCMELHDWQTLILEKLGGLTSEA
ncbi:lipopolysaccharide heptosyltransferase family protein [bacterium]|nr:lipopolysaccharide heptosyltransferase family protein [bacterium]